MNYSGDFKKAKDLFYKAKEMDYAKSMGWIKIGLNLYEGKLYEEALYAFQMVDKYLTDEKSPWHMGAWVWQGHIHDLTNNRKEAINCYNKALTLSTGSGIQHGQFNLTIDENWIKERLKLPFKGHN